MGVIRHRGGRRDLLLYDVDDPDRALSVSLTSSEAAALAWALMAVELVGPSVSGVP